jgi:hypothetical protein
MWYETSERASEVLSPAGGNLSRSCLSQSRTWQTTQAYGEQSIEHDAGKQEEERVLWPIVPPPPSTIGQTQ